MEYIKKEELIEGEIYKHDNGNIVQYQFLNENDRVCGKFIRVPNHFQFNLIDHPGRFTISNLTLATPEEKHWLLECIRLDKFIIFEEAIKSFVPEYVECIKIYHGMIGDSEINKIYKTSEKCEFSIHNWIHVLNHKSYFKPSTKEAYDAQFVIKEPEFVLPEYWQVEINKDNADILNEWRNTSANLWDIKPEPKGYLTSKKWYDLRPLNNYTEITFEQFKKYVLKEETFIEFDNRIDKEIIELLPQFKVIETVETITKVENNEGNQFFIGDKVKSSNNIISKIESFEYNQDKSKILAHIINSTRTDYFDINEIEHYIEPKIEFILPEKWCIKSNNEEELKKVLEFKPINDCRDSPSLIFYRHFPLPKKGCTCYHSIQNNYTEITLEEFKKHVLKEDEPIIITESTKDMLDLKSKGVDSIVLPNETLLDKAKRLYPIGTKFIPTQRGLRYADTSSGKFKEINGDIFHYPTSVSVYFSGQWAEIVGYPHSFKIGDKIKLLYAIKGEKHEIIKIEGNELFYNFNQKERKILAKNAIKVN